MNREVKEQILQKIKEYDRIFLFRHVRPAFRHVCPASCRRLGLSVARLFVEHRFVVSQGARDQPRRRTAYW